MVQTNLLQWLRSTTLWPSNGPPETRQQEATKIVTDMLKLFIDEDEVCWVLPETFWATLTATSDGALLGDGVPGPKATNPPQLYPAIACVANDVFGNQAWHALLLKQGQPFTWERSVLVSAMMPDQVEQVAVQHAAEAKLANELATLCAQRIETERVLEQTCATHAELANSKATSEATVKEALDAELKKINLAAECAAKKYERHRANTADSNQLELSNLHDELEEAEARIVDWERRLADQTNGLDAPAVKPADLTADELVELLGVYFGHRSIFPRRPRGRDTSGSSSNTAKSKASLPEPSTDDDDEEDDVPMPPPHQPQCPCTPTYRQRHVARPEFSAPASPSGRVLMVSTPCRCSLDGEVDKTPRAQRRSNISVRHTDLDTDDPFVSPNQLNTRYEGAFARGQSHTGIYV
ncbi:hypothetical protein C8J57DRAFT_1254678 [Mycena rebaudengoi]|nr:hypothetical protein C8J57DRAFT_1254678 [Mycena rebaudengoi]